VTAWPGLLELEPLLQAAGPVEVPLPQRTAAILDTVLIGLRFGRRYRPHVAGVAVARDAQGEPPVLPGPRPRGDLDPLGTELRVVALSAVGRHQAVPLDAADLVARGFDYASDLAPVLAGQASGRDVGVGKGGGLRSGRQGGSAAPGWAPVRDWRGPG